MSIAKTASIPFNNAGAASFASGAGSPSASGANDILSPDAMIIYCQSRLRNLDSQINQKIEKQRQLTEPPASVAQLKQAIQKCQEAKINDKGNSGQYFRAQFAPGFPPGYEAQINATGGDPIRTGSLYPDARAKLGEFRDKITVMKVAPHKADEWFTQLVVARGSHITISVNGKQTIDFTHPNQVFSKGHFALQGHDPGTVVTFKTVEWRPVAKK